VHFAILLAEVPCHTATVPRPRKLRPKDIAARSAAPDDLYDYARSPAPRRGPPALGDPTTSTVTDDWPEDVLVTEAEREVFEVLFDELFSTRH
jgi:hypothetical protein